MAKKQCKVCKIVELKDIYADELKVVGIKDADVIRVEYEGEGNELNIYEDKDVVYVVGEIIGENPKKLEKITVKVPTGVGILVGGICGRVDVLETQSAVYLKMMGNSDMCLVGVRDVDVTAIGDIELVAGRLTGKLDLGLQGSFEVYIDKEGSLIDDLTVMATGSGEIDAACRVESASFGLIGSTKKPIDVYLRDVGIVKKERVRGGAVAY